MPDVRPALFALLLALLAALEALALAGWGPAPGVSILSVYALFGAASLAVTYVLQTTRARARLFVLGIVAGAAAGIALLLWRDAVSLRTAARGGLALAGLVGLAGYLGDAAAAPDAATRRERLRDLQNAAIVPLAVMQVTFALWATTGLNPVFDAHVLAVEAALGLDLTAWTHGLFASLPGLSHVAMACYFALPVGLAVVVQLQPSPERQQRVLLAALACGIAGFVFYVVSPVAGTLPAYPDGVPPLATLVPAPLTIAAEVPRNGMPSLHTAWALLIGWNAWRLARAWRYGLAAFAALNVYAAAGAVGHWMLDVVVGVPLAAAMQIALLSAAPASTRVAGTAACGLLVAGWTVGLRLGLTPVNAAVPAWLLVVATLAVPVVALARAGAQRVRP